MAGWDRFDWGGRLLVLCADESWSGMQCGWRRGLADQLRSRE
jgi:hypothetical protein